MRHVCILSQICPHTGPEIDPDHRDADPTASCVKEVSAFIQTYLKGISTTPSISEMCMYTVRKRGLRHVTVCWNNDSMLSLDLQMTPDENPVLDRHPSYSNIIIGAAFSGNV